MVRLVLGNDLLRVDWGVKPRLLSSPIAKEFGSFLAAEE